MAAPSTVVIKVKHGDILRRFSTQISVNDELTLTMDLLRKKIVSLFNFDPDTKFMLTYVDEDNDLVTLDNDDDLRDVVKQDLKPLRINVKVGDEKNGLHTSLNPSGSPHDATNNVVPEILKTLPGPLYETLLKLSVDLTSQASSVRAKAKLSVDQLTTGDDSSSKEKSISKESESPAKTKPAVKNDDKKPKRGPKPSKPAAVGATHHTNAGPMNTAKSVDFPGSNSWYSPMFECPFSGLGTGTGTAFSSLPASEVNSSRSGISHNDYSGSIFHRGICCDGCGVHPITGPRFKSKVKFDYDLCSICFEDMGNDTDYIRMDRPAVYRHMTVKGLHEAASGPTFQQVHRSSKFKPVLPKLDSCFIKDVTIFDGTLMAPSTPFTKIWRMKNNGTSSWPEKTKLVWIGGDKLSKELVVEIPPAGLMINEEFEVGVDFISPELPGRYISYWRIAQPSGQQFGQRVWVLIQVDSSLADTPPLEKVRNLNLNLPHVNINGPEIINVDDQPIVEDVSFGPTIPLKREDPVQKPNTEQKMKFPINDSLLVSKDGSSPRSVSNPSVDLADPVVSDVPSLSPTGHTAHASAPPVVGEWKIEDELPVKTVEEKLLKDLEEMGFKEVDLNKKTLRENGYDLLQAVDDLCGVAEWDPILEELQEMGFQDMETNKMLLKKNNGSIKRVVMDLIAGEKMQ